MCITIFIVNVGVNNVSKKKAFAECENKAESICLEYGIEDAFIDISYLHQYSGGGSVYLLKINGICKDMPMGDIYQLVKEVDSIRLDYNALLLEEVILNGKVYDLNEKNRKELTCNGVTVYIYGFEEDKKKEIQIRNNPPYVGMREEFLEDTVLGKADSVELCRDFYSLQTRARYKTYKWEPTGKYGKYIITVKYRMHKSHRVDDYIDLPADNGYVSNITYTDEKGETQTENYVDTY